MIGMVLIGHARIASEMLNALQYVLGEQPLVKAIDVDHRQTPEKLTEALYAAAQRCDVGDGVLILADMFGGTPCNVAMGCLEAGRVEVISGFNLPLLIKAATLREQEHDVVQLAQHVAEAGRRYIQVAPSHAIHSRRNKSPDGAA